MSENNLPEWEASLPADTVTAMHTKLEECKALRDKHTIYPPQEQVLNALVLVAPQNVKVVIVGQDPYHGSGQAMGLAFSVNKGIALPPSLVNIYTELQTDLGIDPAKHGDLTSWAKQGVLLLNTSLTVMAGQANSMAEFGWAPIINSILKTTLLDPQPKVYLCWGKFAHKVVSDAVKQCDPMSMKNKYLIRTTHPSPFSAHRSTTDAPAFIGSRQFSKTNQLLKRHGIQPIDWCIK